MDKSKHGIKLLLTLALASPAMAGNRTTVPVFLQTPTCDYDKLGQVSTHAGTRVSETMKDPMVSAVDYRLAFAQLAAAASAQGGNAVVVRWHHATYFTRMGRRTTKPVYVQLRGAVIRMHEDLAQCSATEVDPVDFARRAARGEPTNVSSAEAYRDE